MKTFFLKYWLCLVCCFIFGLHFLLERFFNFHLQFIDNYLDPFLMMPIVLTLYLWEKPLLQKSGTSLNITEITLITSLISFLAELVFPLINSRCVGDYWDILSYFLGSSVYWISKVLKLHPIFAFKFSP
jgi:hypothetical protein